MCAVMKLGPSSLLTDFPDPKAHELIFRQGDLDARIRLMDLMDAEYDLGNHEGCAALFHAEMYLPYRMAIPLNRKDWPPVRESA